jgi:hypothetical protein
VSEPKHGESTVRETADGQEMPANKPVRDGRATVSEDPRSASVRGSEGGSASESNAAGAPARVPRQAFAPLKHGARAEVALAPSMRAVKREIVKRFGLRLKDLDASGRAVVHLLARAETKLQAIDRWLEQNPVVSADGQPAACLPIYATLLNTAARLHAQLLAVIEAQGRADSELRRHLLEHYGGGS